MYTMCMGALTVRVGFTSAFWNITFSFGMWIDIWYDSNKLFFEVYIIYHICVNRQLAKKTGNS